MRQKCKVKQFLDDPSAKKSWIKSARQDKQDGYSPRERNFKSRRAGFTEERIVAILKAAEAGVANTDVENMEFQIKRSTAAVRSVAAMAVSDVRRPMALEEENARLKKIVGQ